MLRMVLALLKWPIKLLMSIIDPAKVIMSAPQYQLDQIVGIVEGTINVGAGSTDAFGTVTNATASDIKPTPDAKMYFYKGVWSYDNGASWQELGNSIPLGGSANGPRTLTVSASIYNNSPVATIDDVGDAVVEVDVQNGGTAGFTILYRVLMIVRPDQKFSTPNQLPAVLNYSSRHNYMKIYKDFIKVAPAAGNTVFNHALGYVPNVNCWLVLEQIPSDGTFGIFTGNLTIDSANVTSKSPHTSAGNKWTIYARTYLDG